MALDPDAEALSEVERLLVGEPELTSEFVDANVG
jgi:hypothetical protein